ncbi:ribosomal L1 domain-containing protein 1-like [Mucor ambiguus]|uniref:Ribosomal L1 domain-containing protein 1-like n=1 Tax=Mucor ambiguus TaxID=91626 RepID=A0A0C9LXX8_9FUNG|nr:ribosomal L1 domain-containing protein 1-like [Mucor ambiguus]
MRSCPISRRDPFANIALYLSFKLSLVTLKWLMTITNMVHKLDLNQAKKAIAALYKKNKQNAGNDMLQNDEDNFIYVEIHTHKIMNKAQSKQKQIKLPNSPYPENYEICYFTKDDEKVVEGKTQNTAIKKVIGLNALKTVYKSYESKRKLATSYNLYVVDDRVAPLIPGLLGKSFQAKNRMPIKMKHSGNMKTNVDNILHSTNVKLHNGLKTRVVIGNFGMSEKDVLKNYEAAVPEIVKTAAHGWDQVEMLGVKCEGLPYLPTYTSLPKADTKTTAEKKETVSSENDEKPAKKAAPTKKVAAAAAEKKAAAPEKAAAAPKKAAAAPKKAAAAPKKAAATSTAKKTAVAPAKKTETKKVTKKAAASKSKK